MFVGASYSLWVAALISSFFPSPHLIIIMNRYEGGKLMDIPDVEPGELQTHSEFQSGEEGVRWYAGGRMEHRDLAAEAAARENEDFDPIEDLTHENEEDPYWSLHPRKIRVQITSVVTNSSTNSTAIDYVHKVYDFLRNATDNDPRIGYQIQCVLEEGEVSTLHYVAF